MTLEDFLMDFLHVQVPGGRGLGEGADLGAGGGGPGHGGAAQPRHGQVL